MSAIFMSEPAVGAVAHTKNDETTFHPTRGVYVGSAGTMKVDMAKSGTAVSFTAVAGYHPISVTRIYATDTAASGFVLLY